MRLFVAEYMDVSCMPLQSGRIINMEWHADELSFSIEKGDLLHICVRHAKCQDKTPQTKPLLYKKKFDEK